MSPAKTKKGMKKMFQLPWKKPKAPAAIRNERTLVASVEVIVRDPITQCTFFLVLVASACLIFKMRRRRIKLRAARALLFSAPYLAKEQHHCSLPSPKVEDKCTTLPVIQATVREHATAPSRTTPPPSVLVEFEKEKENASLPAHTADVTLRPTFKGGPINDDDDSWGHSNSEDSSHQRSHSSMSHSSYQRRRAMRSNSFGSCFTCDSSTAGEVSLGSSSNKPAYLTIFYASQSGTSAYYSAQLQREAAGMGFDVALRSVRSLAEQLKNEPFPEQELRNILVPHTTKRDTQRGRAVFLISTYHEGGPTDDARTFVELLRSVQSTDCLRGLRYSVFGFGDSGYGQTFNAQAKLYDNLFDQLGAKRITSPGLGDHSKDLDFDFEIFKWRKLFPRLADLSVRDSFKPGPMLGNETGEPTLEGGKAKKKRGRMMRDKSSALVTDPDGGFILQMVDACAEGMSSSHLARTIHSSARHFVKGVDCPVKQVKILSHAMTDAASGAKPCSAVLVEIDTSPSTDGGIEPFRYETGDNIGVLPINNLVVVEELAKHLDIGLDTTFTLAPKDENDLLDFEPPFPTPCTVRDYLSFYCELSTPPRRSIVRSLSQFATFEGDRDELHRISSVKSYAEFQSRIVDQNIGLADLITTYFPSLRIPLVSFIRHCPPMQHRWYSVSSSSLVNPHLLSITFSVLSIPRTIDNSVCHGACSHYLASLSPAQHDRCRITRMGNSGFVAPKDPTTPLIMICNGTGISPFRALLQEVDYKKTVLRTEIGPVVLFYGIRRLDCDLLFKEELEMFVENGSLTDLYIACSREKGEPVVHVQDLLAQHTAQVWTLLQSGAHIYTCGATGMTNDVDAVLRSMASNSLGPVEASSFMNEIEREHRYVREGWTPGAT